MERYIAQNENYKLEIFHDDYASFEFNHYFGEIVCFHDRYSLGSNVEKDYIKCLYNILETEFTHIEVIDFLKSEKVDFSEYKPMNDDNEYDLYELLNENVITYELFTKLLKTKFIVLPLYLTEHGGLTLSTAPCYHDKWDTSRVGFIYNNDKNEVYDETVMESLLETTVAEYNLFINNECYAFEFSKMNEDKTEWISLTNICPILINIYDLFQFLRSNEDEWYTDAETEDFHKLIEKLENEYKGIC